MPTDTHGLSNVHEGKTLRMFFTDGEVCEVKLLHVEVHEDCHICDGYSSFIYDMISTNRPDRYNIGVKSAYSGNFEDIARFEVLDDLNKVSTNAH